MRLYLDLETYSPVPIAHGAYAYAEAAQVRLFAWALNDAPATVWAPEKEAIPEALCAALEDELCTVTAHNSTFDRTVLRSTLPHLCPSVERWRDTMVKALTLSLPGALADLCAVLNLPANTSKDAEGKRLLRLFCQRPGAGKPLPDSASHPDDWALFKNYARLDVEAMRAVDARLSDRNYTGPELSLWHLDQKINDRGFAVDSGLAAAVVDALREHDTRQAAAVALKTGGSVGSARQTAKVLTALREHGAALPDLKKSTVRDALAASTLSATARELLENRAQTSGTSAAKCKAILRAANSDGRLRGSLQFAGASRTGRWAGRLFQPQNLPRPTLAASEIEGAIDCFKTGVSSFVLADVPAAASSVLRSCIWAPAGRKIVAADLSNIEGRVQAWLAGEQWKLYAFEAFDGGRGYDLYKLAYARSFGVPVQDVTPAQRQVGKVQELALGYQGGVGAFATFANAYGIDLDSLARTVLTTATDAQIAKARDALEWARKNKRALAQLSEDTWLSCSVVKQAWRDAHPRIVAFWRALEDVTRRALAVPNMEVRWGALTVVFRDAWLYITLPSGRALCYPGARLAPDGKVTYMGANQLSRKWARQSTYGGKLFENVCQAVARDVLAHNLAGIQTQGYDIVLTVHDEVVCEADDTDDHDLSAEYLADLLATRPAWAYRLPLNASGFEGRRYTKE